MSFSRLFSLESPYKVDYSAKISERLLIKNHPQICLFQPEIPQNTGNIGRLAAASGCRLHLIKPFGFKPDDKNLLRPGLDYWPFLDLEIHDDLDSLLSLFEPGTFAFFSKKAKRVYYDLPIDTKLILFGRETSGFPDELFTKYPDSFYSIPIYHPGVRSLNLANSVSIVLYELLRRKHNHDS